MRHAVADAPVAQRRTLVRGTLIVLQHVKPSVQSWNSLTTGSRAADKIGLLGSIVSAMGCAGCFPAIASLGAAIGLGVLSQYEGLFIRILLPAFAGLALLANLIAWRFHRRWQRAIPALIGPLLVLAAVAVMLVYSQRSGWLLYPGLVIMLGVSVYDLARPARRCRVGSKTVTAGRKP